MHFDNMGKEVKIVSVRESEVIAEAKLESEWNAKMNERQKQIILFKGEMLLNRLMKILLLQVKKVFT